MASDISIFPLAYKCIKSHIQIDLRDYKLNFVIIAIEMMLCLTCTMVTYSDNTLIIKTDQFVNAEWPKHEKLWRVRLIESNKFHSCGLLN